MLSVGVASRSVRVAASRRCLSAAPKGEPSPQMANYNTTKPYLFSEKPPAAGSRRKWQHWESSFYMLSGGTAAAIYYYWDRPNTSVTDWAKDEAEERQRRRAAGESVVYGVNYAMMKQMDRDVTEEETRFSEEADEEEE